MLRMRRYALLRPTELAQLAELSERHEELMRQLEADPGGFSGTLPEPVLGARDLHIELRQLRQEALKVLATISQTIEQL